MTWRFKVHVSKMKSNAEEGGGDPSSVNEFDLGAALDTVHIRNRNAGPGRHLPWTSDRGVHVP